MKFTVVVVAVVVVVIIIIVVVVVVFVIVVVITSIVSTIVEHCNLKGTKRKAQVCISEPIFAGFVHNEIVS